MSEEYVPEEASAYAMKAALKGEPLAGIWLRVTREGYSDAAADRVVEVARELADEALAVEHGEVNRALREGGLDRFDLLRHLSRLVSVKERQVQALASHLADLRECDLCRPEGERDTSNRAKNALHAQRCAIEQERDSYRRIARALAVEAGIT